MIFLYKSPLVNRVTVERALNDTVVNFDTQLAATCPRITQSLVDINGIPSQKGELVDVAWGDVLFFSRRLFGK